MDKWIRLSLSPICSSELKAHKIAGVKVEISRFLQNTTLTLAKQNGQVIMNKKYIKYMANILNILGHFQKRLTHFC